MTSPEDALALFRNEVAAQRVPLPRVEEGENLIVRSEEVLWFESAHNPARLAPVLGTPMKTFELFLQEFAPGGTSDMQQHHHEAVHFVISGRGYSEIGGKRYDWKNGDFICVPPMQWHRHYNGSDTEIVRMLLIENTRLLESLGLNYRVSVGLKTADELLAYQQRQPPAGE